MPSSLQPKVILDLCGGTGAWSRPYREAGYDVRVVTLPGHDIEHWREYPELMELIHGNRVHGILAAPPCTMFSFMRNDMTAKQPRDLRRAFATVNACLELIHECLYDPHQVKDNSLRFWVLENPRDYLARFLGKPAFVFDPCDFGDPYTKRTHLWGMFRPPRRNPVEPYRPPGRHANFVRRTQLFAYLKEDQIPPGYAAQTGIDRQSIMRSITPKGLARAFFEANP